MGTPDFSVPTLKALNEETEYNIQAVVTQPDRKVGRKKKLTAPPVKEYALEADLKVLQPEKITGSNEMDEIISLQPDLIITAAYGQFLPAELLDIPKFGSINIHASLLPKYRGAAPIHYAVMNGDEETGITIMYMDKKMDAGDILTSTKMKIEPEDNTGTLFKKLSILGRDLTLDTLPKLFEKELSAEKQDENLVSYAPMIRSDQEEIKWENTAEVLLNQLRALTPFAGTFTFLDGERFKVWEAEVIDQQTSKEPGTVVEAGKKHLYVASGQGTVLSLKTVQPAGKSKMPINNYLSGASLKEGKKFGEKN